MCGPEGDDGGTHAQPKPSPLPPSSAASSAERVYLHKLLTAPERRHMRVEGVRVRGCVPYQVPSFQRAELCARALGAGGAQDQSVLAGNADDVEVEIARPSATCAVCSPPRVDAVCRDHRWAPPRRRTGGPKGRRVRLGRLVCNAMARFVRACGPPSIETAMPRVRDDDLTLCTRHFAVRFTHHSFIVSVLYLVAPPYCHSQQSDRTLRHAVTLFLPVPVLSPNDRWLDEIVSV